MSHQYLMIYKLCFLERLDGKRGCYKSVLLCAQNINKARHNVYANKKMLKTNEKHYLVLSVSILLLGPAVVFFYIMNLKKIVRFNYNHYDCTFFKMRGHRIIHKVLLG